MTTPPPRLGATVDGGGVRFAVASSTAEAVELCLLDDGGGERRVPLDVEGGTWTAFVPGVAPGQRYGYRVHGPWDPARGVFANPAKLLVDPYARRVHGRVTDLGAALAVDPVSGGPSPRDSAGAVPVSVVTAPGGPPTGPRPAVPWDRTVVYEAHVRGLTARHPAVPPELRGTYLGAAHPAVVGHLVDLGVTALELLPVAAFADEPSLLRDGRRNYWGYAPLALGAVHAGYAAVPGAEVEEFRTMVAALHAAGIEVLVDVVANHTCEGGVDGTALCYRGLDGPAYYLAGDLTGCGNTLHAGSPTVIALVVDALRHWVTELGVDGFRFDLASVLGRPGGGPFDPRAPLLTAIAGDPVLAGCKLVAEPWDATAEGYRVGGFGPAWAEWNGRYRDTVRDFWRGRAGIGELASRLAGSSDLYGQRGPWASVGFVTAHDGFTARDLVSYDRKHNDANGEDGRDGTDDNRSWNGGLEGPTPDPGIRALRARQVRDLLGTLLLSTGTPMLLAGDEQWNTQDGNNNPYCVDGPTTWLAWAHLSQADDEHDDAAALLAYVRRALALRASAPALRRSRFFEGEGAGGEPDLVWLRSDGLPVQPADWESGDVRTLGAWLGADPSAAAGEEPGPWLLLLHSGHEPVTVVLPDRGHRYEPVLDSGAPDGVPLEAGPTPGGGTLELPARTLLLLRVVR